jgi:hypothetical protein
MRWRRVSGSRFGWPGRASTCPPARLKVLTAPFALGTEYPTLFAEVLEDVSQEVRVEPTSSRAFDKPLKFRDPRISNRGCKGGCGMTSAATIEAPIHSPQVCDPVIEPVVSAAAWRTASSEKKARVAVTRTNQKRPHTSSLLRLRDAPGPISSLQITGVDRDQRVNGHISGIGSSDIVPNQGERPSST